MGADEFNRELELMCEMLGFSPLLEASRSPIAGLARICDLTHDEQFAVMDDIVMRATGDEMGCETLNHGWDDNDEPAGLSL